MMIHRFPLLVMPLLLLACLDPRQDHDVNPVETPSYSLYGSVWDAASNDVVRNATVSVQMSKIVQGEWITYREGISDSSGSYIIDSLYRGQYLLEVASHGERSFSKLIDMMLYEDRQYDIHIPLPPDIDFQGRVTQCGASVFLSDALITLSPVLIENSGIVNTKTVRSNSLGVFKISDLYEGRYQIEISRSGYTSHSQILTIDNPDQKLFELDFCLNQSITN